MKVTWSACLTAKTKMATQRGAAYLHCCSISQNSRPGWYWSRKSFSMLKALSKCYTLANKTGDVDQTRDFKA